VIQTQLALIRRELWEHRAVYVAPIVIALIVLLGLVTGQVSVSALDHVVDIAILGASNLGDNERAIAITMLLTAPSPLFLAAMMIITVFYTLDSLYAERKDRSILFWRSIPVTDSETVVSKLLIALIVIPLITFGVIMVTHLGILVISSVWVGVRGANAWHLIWSAAPLFENWLATLIIVLALPLWFSPFLGWFLLVSAFTKRSPFLTAFLPLIMLPMLEKIFLGSGWFAHSFFDRGTNMPLLKGLDVLELLFGSDKDTRLVAESGLTLLSFIDLGRFATSPGLWAGFVVCGLFASAAVYIRRFRDET